MRDSIKLTQWDNGDMVDIKVADILSVFVSLTSSPDEGCTIIVLNQPSNFIIVKESHKDVMGLIQNDRPGEVDEVDDNEWMGTFLFRGESIKCYVSQIQESDLFGLMKSRTIRKFEIIEA